MNLVTDTPEIVFPRNKRILRYLKSALVGVPFLIIAIGTMICGLNTLGYVDENEIFLIPFLARLAKPGGLF